MLMFTQVFSCIPPLWLWHHTWASWIRYWGASSLDKLAGSSNHTTPCQCVGTLAQLLPLNTMNTPTQSLHLPGYVWTCLKDLVQWWIRVMKSGIFTLFLNSRGKKEQCSPLKCGSFFFCRFSFWEHQLYLSVYQDTSQVTSWKHHLFRWRFCGRSLDWDRLASSFLVMIVISDELNSISS